MTNGGVLEQIAQKKTKKANPKLFFGSLFLFMLIASYFWGWEYSLLILLVIFFHECGHYLMFKIFGCKNVNMVFVPMLGGFVSANEDDLTSTKRVIVFLAGPVFGLIVAFISMFLAGFVSGFTGNMQSANYIVSFVGISIFINLLNLLPFLPLDGGQVANVLIFSRNWLFEAVFRALSLIALAAWFIYIEAYSFLIIPAFLLMGLSGSIKIRRIVADFKKKNIFSDKITEDNVELIRNELIKYDVKDCEIPKFIPNYVSAVWEGVRLKAPSVIKSFALFFAYIFIFAFGAFLGLMQIHLASGLEKGLEQIKERENNSAQVAPAQTRSNQPYIVN